MTLAKMTDLGVLLQAMEKYDEAEELFEEALEGRRIVYGMVSHCTPSQ